MRFLHTPYFLPKNKKIPHVHCWNHCLLTYFSNFVWIRITWHLAKKSESQSLPLQVWFSKPQKAPGYNGCPMSRLEFLFHFVFKRTFVWLPTRVSIFLRVTSYGENIRLERKPGSTIQVIWSLPLSGHKFPQLEINKAELQDLSDFLQLCYQVTLIIETW